MTLSFCGVVGGVVCKAIFMSNPTKVILNFGSVELWLSWGFDNYYSSRCVGVAWMVPNSCV